MDIYDARDMVKRLRKFANETEAVVDGDEGTDAERRDELVELSQKQREALQHAAGEIEKAMEHALLDRFMNKGY